VFFPQKRASYQYLKEEFPWHRNREIFRANRELNSPNRELSGNHDRAANHPKIAGHHQNPAEAG
jgi:hypothetical protein